MRILHINCNYIGTTLHQLMIEKLDTLGIENEVFVPTYDKNIAVIRPNRNVYVSECFGKWDRAVFDYKQAKILKAIEDHYDLKSFDLIHAYTLFTDGNVARILSERYGIPYVAAIRNTDVNDFFRKMFFLRDRGVKNMIMARRIFFLSESYRDGVFKKYVPAEYVPALEAKAEIIPNGIDDFWFQNAPDKRKIIDLSDVRLVYAGGINSNKNISATQAAMSMLRKEGIKTSLTVVGKIVEKKEYERIAADAFTTYIPAQPKEKLIEIYRNHDIFVMPSIFESFGLVYAEAMSQGLPVIYTKGQGFDGQFEEGWIGYHVCAKDIGDLADAIKRVINKYDLLQLNTVSSSRRFEWMKLASKYKRIYEQVLNIQR